MEQILDNLILKTCYQALHATIMIILCLDIVNQIIIEYLHPYVVVLFLLKLLGDLCLAFLIHSDVLWQIPFVLPTQH